MKSTSSELLPIPKYSCNLYEELGMECLDHISGMFAFALYDRGKNKGLHCKRLLRDPTAILDDYWKQALFFIRDKIIHADS